MPNYKQLTENERYQIYTMNSLGLRQKEMAEQLGRSPSTISRELRRNKGLRGYRPAQAQRLAVQRRQNAYKHFKLTDEVCQWIEQLLSQDLSPEQIAGYLGRDKQVSLHHETIYQYIYQDKAYGGQLYKKLRIASKPYRKRYGRYDRRGRIENRCSIDERPAVVERKDRIGDWEGDTIVGKGRRNALLTLVERKSLYTVIIKLKSRTANELADKITREMKHLKSKIITFTFDNGKEFAAHETIAKELNADVYFAHPYSAWERGINENTNGLIRQYFPKGTDFKNVTQKQIQAVMDQLNNRPRKTKDFKAPIEIFKGQRVDLLTA
jgi:IS30 family transposase